MYKRERGEIRGTNVFCPLCYFRNLTYTSLNIFVHVCYVVRSTTSLLSCLMFVMYYDLLLLYYCAFSKGMGPMLSQRGTNLSLYALDLWMVLALAHDMPLICPLFN